MQSLKIVTESKEEEAIETKYISDVVDMSRVKPGVLNLITSGCGTGKSYFVLHKLLDHYHDVKPAEIVVVTSRTLAAQQQGREEDVVNYDASDREILNYWNGDERGEHIVDKNTGIHIMTYNRFIYLLKNCNHPDRATLCNVKIVVLDECHALFSDTFIKDIFSVRVWINDHMKLTKKIFIGLTATPGILYENQLRWGVRINPLHDEPLMRYKAKQLTCTNVSAVPSLIREFSGKTLVMCHSIRQCEELQRKIPDSFVMVSAGNEKKGTFTPEMAWVRDYIVSKSALPDERWVADPSDTIMGGHWVPMKVLIATSTVREGFNLLESSGVRNIVSCVTDSLHVVQVAGRARYCLDNLVVAAPLQRETGSQAYTEYMTRQRCLFSEFMRNENDGSEWFKPIAPIVQHGLGEINTTIRRKDVGGFQQWIDDTWLTTDNEEKWLYKPEDKQELVQKCADFKASNKIRSRLTYQGVLKLLPSMGYTVITGTIRANGTCTTYKVIRKTDQSFEEEIDEVS